MALCLMKSFVIIFSRLSKKCTFLLLRFFFIIVQKIVWKINGTQDIIDRNLHPPDRSGLPVAHRMNVVAWCKGCFIQPGSLRDFILTHDEYVDPTYVTQHDHITLFFFDKRTNLVVFSEASPGQLVWKAMYSPILRRSQFYFSRKLIIMQLSDFHRVCDTLPDPQKPLIFLGNMARCGSTLLTQVFEETGKIVTVSEDYPLIDVLYKLKNDGMTEEVLGLTKAIIRFYCRPRHSLPDVAGYVIKPAGPSSAVAPVVKKLYPDVTSFYLYRNIDIVAKSLFKLSFFIPTLRVSYFIARCSPYLLAEIFKAAFFPPDPRRRLFSNDHSYGIFLAVTSTDTYSVMQKRGEEVHGLLFDDIIRDELTAVKAIFKVSKLPEDLVEPAMKAFCRDSYGNSTMSNEDFAIIEDLVVSDKNREESNEILHEHGFAPLGHETRLPGTLDFSKVLELM